ncbi:hypothetical protein SAMN05192553_1202 [Cyclobacterium xiamenense]|uniref:Uncharacterized protein n=1 Tax=Cyclobacterium xiamenense TaxID=1297121 RepID=A0A1H7BXE5_9BACT|nr:hypothetical protein SAMN05192553_1202 [Cyclobacterium xiamenense]
MKFICIITCVLKVNLYFCLRNKSNNYLSNDKNNEKSIISISSIRYSRFLWHSANKFNKRDKFYK